ncbi:citramalyl-CoA lyase, mitochondrial-like isoform X2 [Babylonia areolata]
MYVPGHDLKKLRKVPHLGVDCAVLECEDGVALDKKAEARENIRMVLDELRDVKGVDIAVRVNSVSSGLVDEDLKAIMSAQYRPKTILLPKVDTVDELVLFTDRFRTAVGSHTAGYCPHLITYVESAEGLMNMKDVLRRADGFSKEGTYHLDGVVFGSDDFCADIGAMRTVDASELTYARQKIVMVARAYRIQAIDMVYIDYKDPEGLRVQSEQGARKGYTGKQVIHPSQVSIVNEAFTPSPERVEWATKLIESFEHHQKSGQGAFTFRGHMIDKPLLLQARNVIQTVENVKKE